MRYLVKCFTHDFVVVLQFALFKAEHFCALWRVGDLVPLGSTPTGLFGSAVIANVPAGASMSAFGALVIFDIVCGLQTFKVLFHACWWCKAKINCVFPPAVDPLVRVVAVKALVSMVVIPFVELHCLLHELRSNWTTSSLPSRG